MGNTMHSSHADASQLASWKAAANTGVIAVAIIVLLVIFIVRVASKPKPYQLFPVWATLEIGLTSHLLSENGLGRRILMLLRRNSGSLVGLSSKHQILIDSPHITRLMAKSILDPLPSQYTLLVRVFGGVDSLQFKEKMDASNRDLRAPVEKVFMNENAATAALERACIPEKVKSFVTFQSNPRDMELWEHSAQIRVINPESGGVEKVEANFQSLIRDFGACIAIPQLYGRDFLDRYPQALEDLWKFDNDLFPLLMIGLPLWAPLKVMKEGLAARTRLITELEALYRRIDQYQQGDPVDFDADMRDVGETALGRNNVYRREGWSFPERGAGDLGLLWGQNANTQPLLFWLLTYLYSTPDIFEQLREELTAYITMSTSIPRELTSMDMQGLSRNCPLLKACIYETYRLVNEPTSIRSVGSNTVHVTDGDLRHELKPGTFVSVPYSLVNRDASIYSDPDKFDPGRFLELDPSSGKLTARYGRLKPWGSGSAMCKGRIFAEKEIVTLAVAIITMWDVGPADGAWKLPGKVPGTGVRKPTNDIRVVITRRT